MPDRLPPPGTSFLREHEVRVGDRLLRAGMSQPSTTDDGWWLALLWIADDEGVVPMRDLASPAGPPAEPPLARLGPSFAGALSGMRPQPREEIAASLRADGVSPRALARIGLAAAADR